MKKTIALILALMMCLPILAGCGSSTTEAPKQTETTTETITETITETTETAGTPEQTTGGEETVTLNPATEPTGETGTETETQYADQNMKYSFGVYNILTADGEHKVSTDRMGKFVLDDEVESRSRFTFHIKERKVKDVITKYYAIYRGDDERETLAISNLVPKNAKLQFTGGGYLAGEKELWTVEDYEDGTCRIIPKGSLKDLPMCLAVDGNEVKMAARDDNDPNQLFRIEKAPQHSAYREYGSDKGNIYVRIHKSFLSKSVGVTDEFMVDFANYFQEAYDAEIELTGFVPYDIIVISGWEDLGYVAGVSDNYNVINANRGFMQSEMSNSVKRLKNLKIFDLSFGLLHELGHMFDSGRGWNFESEAWTDLKLCYAIMKATENHKDTDGIVFGCASADYDASKCFTYETMEKGLDIHKNKGAMETVYGFFGAARLFLLMAYDFGWEPFIKTFHWYQDNGYTANSFERWERFTIFVDKLSEYSGKDIKNDYLTPENWEIFRAYYQGETTEVV